MAMISARKRQSSFHVNWKAILHFIFFILFVIGGIYLVDGFRKHQHFPIKSVKVIGARHIDHDEIQVSLSALVSHGFFNVRVEEIKDKLLQNPWVSDVTVRRIWPDEVMINISEKIPVAYWNIDSLISTSGELFSPGSVTLDDLPKFFGPDGKQIFVMQYFNQLNTLLLPLHFKVVRLELTPGHVWNVTLNNGMKLTTDYKDFLTRFSHFVKVYPKIIGDRAADIDYVDLRYANGLAVRWKTATQNV